MTMGAGSRAITIPTLQIGEEAAMEALRGWVAFWRRRALDVETDQQADFAEYLGLTPSQARLLDRLYEAKGAWVLTWQLASAARISEKSRSVAVMISDLRQALECESIDSNRGIPGGYRLTEVGMAECLRALLPQGTRNAA